MKKARRGKLVAACMCAAALTVAAVGGTFAYLTDTDSDVNVMTLGNVDIEQIEQERDANGALKDFTQGKPAYPAVGPIEWAGEGVEVNGTECKVFTDDLKNVVDKIVTVKNTGKSDAYIRTIVAIEAPDYDPNDLIHINWNSTDTTISDPVKVKIDDADYVCFAFTYKEALEAGKVSAPSLVQVFLDSAATNEDVAKFGDEWEIKVLSQAVQTNGFVDAATALEAAFGKASEKAAEWFGVMEAPVMVDTLEALQSALDNATDGTTVVMTKDITGNITVIQKPGVKITLNGNGNTLAGVLTVDGKSGTYTTAGLTIENLTFKADSISADACIRLGDGTNATRYTCNVTVSDCTFDVPGAVGVKSYTGGDKNLTITDCTATANCHSLVQAKGIDGVLVEDCKVYSKNGLNFNNSDNVVVVGSEVDVKGYAIRFGESSGGAGAAETYLIKDCALKSACDDGDAVIILRGTADYSTLTIENTTITGTTTITNTATDATVITKP